jgi:hypothetical protein
MFRLFRPGIEKLLQTLHRPVENDLSSARGSVQCYKQTTKTDTHRVRRDLHVEKRRRKELGGDCSEERAAFRGRRGSTEVV